MEHAVEPPVDNPEAPASDEEHREAQEDGAIIEEHPAAKRTKKPKRAKQPKKAQPPPKTEWILTYGTSSSYITPAMLKAEGLELDECHSTKDRAMAFTYIHLTTRVRQSSIEKFMKEANAKHGIVQNAIFGYESLGFNSKKGDAPTSIEDHVGFKMLVKHYNTKDPAFVPWTDDEPVLKRGRLLKAATIDSERPAALEAQSKAKIIAYARHLESQQQSHLERHNTLSRVNEELSAENTALLLELSMTRSENATLKRKLQQLESTQIPRN